MAPKIVKTADDVQYAHDLIVGLLLHPTLLPPAGLDTQHLTWIASALCWVLGHGYNEEFAELLAQLEAHSRDEGYTFVREECLLQPALQPIRCNAHDWHHYGAVNGQQYYGCQTCGAEEFR
jgi:hypothetical protein